MNGRQRRRKTAICLTTLLFVLSIVSACNSTPKLSKLVIEPLNISSEDYTWTITWDEIAHASGYKVSIDGKEYETKTNALDIYYLASPGESLRVRVKALGDGKKYGNSEWSEERIHETEPISIDLPSVYTNFPPINFEYALLEDDTYCVSLLPSVDYNKVERIVFPDYYNGKMITALGNKTGECIRFGGVIEESILKSIRLPSGLREIGNKCFTSLGKLNHIRIPKGVTKIGYYSFYDLPALTDLEFPQSNMEFMGGRNFFETPWEREYVSKQPDGCICFGKVLWQHKGALPEEWAFEDLPEEVTMIGGYVFQEKNTKNECSVKVPQQIEKIGQAAFSQWENLRFVDLSATKVETISEDTFYNSTKLYSVLLPKGLKNIEQDAFLYCTSLKEIDLPDGLEEIGISAFSGCSSLEEIVLPDGLKRVGTHAFNRCHSLREITFPGSVVFWGGYNLITGLPSYSWFGSPIDDCANLKKVIFKEGIEVIGGYMHTAYNIEFVFPSTIKNIDQLFNFNLSSTIVVPDGVEILEQAFQHCENLVNVVIPKSVKEIDGRVLFHYSENVKNIFYCGTAEEWEKIHFYDLQEKYPDIAFRVLRRAKPSPHGTLDGKTVYYYSENPPQTAGNYWHYENNNKKVPVAW